MANDLAEADEEAGGDKAVVMPDYDKARGTNLEDIHPTAGSTSTTSTLPTPPFPHGRPDVIHHHHLGSL